MAQFAPGVDEVGVQRRMEEGMASPAVLLDAIKVGDVVAACAGQMLASTLVGTN